MYRKPLACLAAVSLLVTASTAAASAPARAAERADSVDRAGTDAEGERMSGFVLPWYLAGLIAAVAVFFIATDGEDTPASP